MASKFHFGSDCANPAGVCINYTAPNCNTFRKTKLIGSFCTEGTC